MYDYFKRYSAFRSPSMSIPNRWEFPGGKAETYNEIFHDHIHEYDEIKVNLICMKCRVVKGYPTAPKIIWLKRKNLDSLNYSSLK